MNKEDLIKRLAKNTNSTICKSKEMVDELIQIIVFALERGEEVKIAGFGKFWTKYQSARLNHLPNSKILYKISAKFVPKFSISSVLKKRFLGNFG